MAKSPHAGEKEKSKERRRSTRAAKSPSDLIDRQLARYREMRDFDVTREPAGGERALQAESATTPGAGGAPGLPFVVQKHAATRLHYDFRLGLHGVFKSWAVTKGPSYVPSDKRLAVQVEDHPIEYGGFEGAIPKGQYGGGTVMLWDEGTWEPLGDPDEGLAKGNLKFLLHGKKLRGKWVLVRMGGRAAREVKPNWLLIKERDEYERKPEDPPITEEAPDSVATNRDLDAIARDADHVWQSSRLRRVSGGRVSAREKETSRKRPHFAPDLPGEREDMPDFVPPQLASQAARPPHEAGWIHELKLDGYRVQAHIQRSQHRPPIVRLFTRNGLDWSQRMPAIVADLAELSSSGAILDGEVVALNDSGQSSFASLQAAFDEHKSTPLTYFVFDLLHLNGHNLRDQPLVERKQLLANLLATLPPGGSARLSQHIEGDGEAVLTEACRLGAEGIVSKRRSSPYVPGRGSSWMKVKCIHKQELVIGGFTLPSNRSGGVGALLLGYYEDGQLQYAGRTGTGFTRISSRMLRERLEALRRKKPPFALVPAAARRGAIWTDPKMVAEVEFSTWTPDHMVRQASFKGIREDKVPSEVRREEPDPSLAKGSSAAGLETKGAESPRQRARSKRNGPSAAARGGARRAKANRPRGEAAPEPPLPAIRVTNPGKVIDQQTGLTKQALVDYYLTIAEHMLPHIAGRPVSLVRCPSGIAKDCFFQKRLDRGMPRGIEGVKVRDKDGKGSETYVTVSTAEALAGLAQMNVLEIHPWGSTNVDLEHPDRLIFDLDPDDAVSWQTLQDSAREVRERLDKLGLKSFLKATGGKGLHIVAPIRPEHGWSTLKAFAQAFAFQMESENSKLYISKMAKAARRNKIFIDYLRNERGATAIAPYSSRARRGLPVALPLPWSALTFSERPRFAIADFANWRGRLRRDPWKGMAEIDQRFPPEILQSLSASR